MQYIFWLSILIVFYAYLGYGLVLFVLVRLKRLFAKRKEPSLDYFPEVTLIVAAYNEEDFIIEKIKNTLALNYPKDKFRIIFVTDGSTDRTVELVGQFEEIELWHSEERQGKIAAVHRVMKEMDTEIVVFCDANTTLNSSVIRTLVRHFSDDKVGAVAGEKRVLQNESAEAAAAGEGIYWKYESLLKKWDSELCTVVGAAGELFAIRRNIYEPVPKDTIIEDFYMTLRIAQKGYKVIYEPAAYAMETASADVSEELKRKIRIAAGGIQAIVRLKALLNIFKYGWLSFQYVSHRVLRWTLAPLALPLILVSNIWLASRAGSFYQWILVAQTLFYVASALGWLLEKKKIRFKLLFIPYYFCMMNYAVYAGFLRYIKGSQSVVWEKAQRAKGAA